MTFVFNVWTYCAWTTMTPLFASPLGLTFVASKMKESKGYEKLTKSQSKKLFTWVADLVIIPFLYSFMTALKLCLPLHAVGLRVVRGCRDSVCTVPRPLGRERCDPPHRGVPLRWLHGWLVLAPRRPDTRHYQGMSRTFLRRIHLHDIMKQRYREVNGCVLNGTTNGPVKGL